MRFYRQPTRVVGVLASPLVFWLVIGSGFGTSFRSGGGPGQQHYLDYFYPGALIMIVLFTSIFTMMSVIEDRKDGFLLSVLVAPVPRTAIVLGKVMGGTTLSAVQGMIFLIFAPFAGVHLQLLSVSAGRGRGLPGFVFTYRARFRHRLAHGFFASFPRHCESLSDSALAFFGRSVPPRRRLEMDSGGDALESFDLWRRGAARTYVSRSRNRLSAPSAMATLALFSLIMFGLALLMANRRSTRPAADRRRFDLASSVAANSIAQQYAFFPALDATLNGTSAVLLLIGRGLITRGRIAAHRACMIAAVIASALFLGCYLFFHFECRQHHF